RTVGADVVRALLTVVGLVAVVDRIHDVAVGVALHRVAVAHRRVGDEGPHRGVGRAAHAGVAGPGAAGGVGAAIARLVTADAVAVAVAHQPGTARRAHRDVGVRGRAAGAHVVRA